MRIFERKSAPRQWICLSRERLITIAMRYFIFRRIDRSIGQRRTSPSRRHLHLNDRGVPRWNATGWSDVNKTCNRDDLITFNGESFRQLCSPNIELGRMDSIRFTLSTGRIALNEQVPIRQHVSLASNKNRVRKETKVCQQRVRRSSSPSCTMVRRWAIRETYVEFCSVNYR